MSVFTVLNTRMCSNFHSSINFCLGTECGKMGSGLNFRMYPVSYYMLNMWRIGMVFVVHQTID